jgi:hypothetical protein
MRRKADASLPLFQGMRPRLSGLQGDCASSVDMERVLQLSPARTAGPGGEIVSSQSAAESRGHFGALDSAAEEEMEAGGQSTLVTPPVNAVPDDQSHFQSLRLSRAASALEGKTAMAVGSIKALLSHYGSRGLKIARGRGIWDTVIPDG